MFVALRGPLMDWKKMTECQKAMTIRNKTWQTWSTAQVRLCRVTVQRLGLGPYVATDVPSPNTPFK